MASEQGSRDSRRSKYLSLGLGEWVAAATFALVAPIFVAPRLDERAAVALGWALGPLLLVLIQAGAYWLLARGWVGRGTMPGGIARAFRVCRVLGPPVLLTGAVGILRHHPSSLGGALLVWLVWAFGVVEYLNYFVVRLAYPMMSWARSVTQWRRPQLVIDLQTERAAR